MKKKDAVLILSLLLIAGMLFALRFMAYNRDIGDTAVIEVNGEEYMRVSLNDPRRVTIEQPGGAVNIVEITSQGVFMLYASCPDQLCVHQGMVTKQNYRIRPTQAFIICLPHRVTVELIPEADE